MSIIRLREAIPLVGWLFLAFAAVYLAAIDLYDEGQFILSAATLFLVFALRIRYMRTMSDARTLRMTRLVILTLVGVLALRYLIWRFQYSIPWHDDPLSLALSLVLLFAEVFAIGLYFMGVFTIIHPLRREAIPIDMDDDKLPTVDIFVPSYNESADLLRTTLLAATSIHYPSEKLNVYLLDDGGTDAKRAAAGAAGEQARQRHKNLQQLCQDIGVKYLTRVDNQDAKAGNINAALKVTQNEVVVILDSDHVPTMNFLAQTIGTLMKHPDMALVQTPHHMINQDPLEKNLKAPRNMPTEGDMFYSLNLRGMDNWNAGFFCGSGALIRRSVLEEVGGVCTDTIVEDADTSLEMLTRGYRTAYLHVPVLAGLSSDTVDALAVQRSRWAAGMIQLLRMKNPLFRKGLSLPQRISYFNCSAYWLFSLVRMVFVFTPILALCFGVVFFAAPPVRSCYTLFLIWSVCIWL